MEQENFQGSGILVLGSDMLLLIFDFLICSELIDLKLVCRKFRDVLKGCIQKHLAGLSDLPSSEIYKKFSDPVRFPCLDWFCLNFVHSEIFMNAFVKVMEYDPDFITFEHLKKIYFNLTGLKSIFYLKLLDVIYQPDLTDKKLDSGNPVPEYLIQISKKYPGNPVILKFLRYFILLSLIRQGSMFPMITVFLLNKEDYPIIETIKERDLVVGIAKKSERYRNPEYTGFQAAVRSLENKWDF